MLRRALPVLLAALVLLAAACSSSPPGGQTPSTPDRVGAIRAARAAVAEPASALGTAASTLTQDLDRLVAMDTAAAGTSGADALEPALASLSGAVAAADAVTLDSAEVADVAAARAALADAATAGGEAARAVTALLADARRAADLDTQLDELVALWQEGGSRSRQLERFDAAVTQADSLAVAVAADPGTACSDALALRAEAAQHVAEITRELRGYIASYQGDRYDERRLEVAEDPYGLGMTLDEAAPLSSCAATATARQQLAEVGLALARLQAALNPTDL